MTILSSRRHSACSQRTSRQFEFRNYSARPCRREYRNMLKSWCYLLGACAYAFQADAQPTPPREAERSKANTPVSRGPEACGKNPAIYWAGAGPKVQVLRHGTFRMRKALEPEGASTEAVVVEVRIESKKPLPMARASISYAVDQPRKNLSKRLVIGLGGGMVRPVYRPPWSSSLMRVLWSSPVCNSKAVAPRLLGRAGALGHLHSKLPLRREILQQAALRPSHCLKELFGSGERDESPFPTRPLNVVGLECKVPPQC